MTKSAVFRWINWKPHDTGEVKLNVDGAKNNPGIGGGGAVLRDHHSRLIFAKSVFFGHVTNVLAETLALLEGVKVFVNLHVSILS